MTRRNPLVVLLCLELMLNGANLALIAFSRMWGNGDGQILALVVMTVAACEVCIGLGHDRRDLPPHACRSTSTSCGSCRVMSTTDAAGWLVLAVPARRDARHRASASARLPGRTAGWIGTAAIALSFVAAVGALISLQGHAPAHRQLISSLWNYASTVGIDAKMSILVDPLSVFMILLVTGVSTLIHLYSISYMDEDRGFARFFAYLNFFVFSMLLLVLAGNFLLLIVGWAFVGAASYLLISFWYRRTTATRAGHQGVRDQRRRRRRARARHLLHLQAHRHARLPAARSTRPKHGAFGRARRRRPRRRAACCCSSARSRSRRRSRCTPGCPTRWRARRRSAR